MEALKIQGVDFADVYSPSYQAGHPVNEVEAEVLNQTERENLRNNFAKKVKEALEANGGTLPAEVHEKLRSELAELAANYQFNVRQPRQTDPVMAYAMELVIAKIQKALREQGVKAKDVTTKEIKDRAKAAIDANPKILEQAKALYEKNQAALNSITL